MEPEASKAAISAIAALQERVRSLEKEQRNIFAEMDSYKHKINSRDERVQQRTKMLEEASNKAKEMLNYVSECNHDLIVARDLNKKLKTSIKKVKESLNEGDEEEEEMKREKIRSLRTELTNANQKVSDYEIILSEFLKPVPSSCSPDGALMLAVSDGDANLLPQPIRTVIENLQRLPKDFKSQTIEEKRDTVQLLTIARNQTRILSKQIKDLEVSRMKTKEKDRFDSDIKKLAAQHLLISTEMNKFTF